MTPDVFQERFLNFSADILMLVSKFPKNQAGRHIADQLFRSGTSVGAHLEEARAGESRADFIHKMQVALKELREVGYWLKLVTKTNLVADTSLPRISDECEQLTAMLAQSVITAKRNGLQNYQVSRQTSEFKKPTL